MKKSIIGSNFYLRLNKRFYVVTLAIHVETLLKWIHILRSLIMNFSCLVKKIKLKNQLNLIDLIDPLVKLRMYPIPLILMT